MFRDKIKVREIAEKINRSKYFDEILEYLIGENYLYSEDLDRDIPAFDLAAESVVEYLEDKINEALQELYLKDDFTAESIFK